MCTCCNSPKWAAAEMKRLRLLKVEQKRGICSNLAGDTCGKVCISPAWDWKEEKEGWVETEFRLFYGIDLK